ncbi:DUF58 domain-containing protein [Blastopirellula sp. JC732]|uniref:DUF58 domain-containing protein n=1 Tax=Blastopirellula sediminis TaxID=2894196 RepID=A0A9X1SDZ0_9BACT|nr:DUF58 domain-containing protein [Blastopirellula sediminis]MCC9608002.1 DUF58 domain-containing protein [Blastopirellula sediminis]MCC9627205.1 DUF58 domain-containing protein [Blastopirellula sediminis]
MSTAANRSTGHPQRGAALIDPGSLMRIKNLELRARAIVEGFLSGLHRSPYHGFSVEFTEYRQYSPGDDPRFLDWKLYARSDRYFIKCFEDETNLRCHLLVDLSRSMNYGTVGYSKAEYAKTAAATVAYFLSLQRDAVGLLTFDEKIVDVIPPRFRTGHIHHLMMSLERAPAGKGTDIEKPLEQIAATVAKRGVVVLISDLLTPIGALKKNLSYLRARGHEVVILRVLDPREVDFAFDQPAMFHDIESGRDLYIDPAAARDNYLSAFQEHSGSLQTICNQLGIELHMITIDRPLELMLFDLLTERMNRGANVRQRTPAGGGAS